MGSRRLTSTLIAGAVVFAGCGDDTSSDRLELDRVWARPTVEGAATAAVYLTIDSPVDDELLSGSVDESVAAAVTLHETRTEAATPQDTETATETDHSSHQLTTMSSGMSAEMSTAIEPGGHDMTSMSHLDGIDVPAGETVELSPGGLHVMLDGLSAPLAVGDSFELTLEFAETGTRTVTVEVSEEAP